MSAVEVGGLFRPVDGEVDLADLLERFGGVLQPGCDLPVLGVGPDDGVDVVVEHGQPLGVPVQGEPVVGVLGVPPFGGAGTESRLDFGQPFPVGGHADLAKCRGVGHGVEFEVVDLAVELELHHPVDQLPHRRPGRRGCLRVEFQEATTGVADDAAGIVGSGDHLQ